MTVKLILAILLVGLCIDAFEYNTLLFTNNSPFKRIFKREFSIFTNYVDCNERLPVLFHYIAKDESGNFTRLSTFKLDPMVNASCNQLSAGTYNSVYNGWDRGHMVPAHHLDHSLEGLRDSNYMTNITPQTVTLNRGAWLQSEDIIECWRTNTTLNVFGGIIMAKDNSRDFFYQSHGVRTPQWNWKAVVRQSDNDIIVWNMPNDETPSRKNIDLYLTSLKRIEELTGFTFPQFTAAQKNKIQPESWQIPTKCQFAKLMKSSVDTLMS